MRVHTSDKQFTQHVELLTNDAMAPLFLAVIEATEEAIYNSMLRTTTMNGNGHTVERQDSGNPESAPVYQVIGSELLCPGRRDRRPRVHVIVECRKDGQTRS